jgi:hypothetical protein
MNKEISHNDYYAQFITDATKKYILSELTVEQIKESIYSGDEHLNEIKIPFNNMGIGGSWWWDYSPINLNLARKLKEVGENSLPSRSTRTCIGKAAARILIKDK